ncbi:hypothetical protein BUALT_Bualt18G0069600 [Buddleja alternifolia]|uniref:Retrotransposon gag domain-containing protein n=1 Tax=Buddleja alternifolia TaxID=168488 RepID=A0AAV6W8T3_9LAMI|nr:hypothetical protein BUALT_Bualt18G0069600 [Buddleja alternifolia]
MRPRRRNTEATANGEPRRDERAEGSRINTRISNRETDPNNEQGSRANDEDVNQGVDAQRFARVEDELRELKSLIKGLVDKGESLGNAPHHEGEFSHPGLPEGKEWETRNILRQKLEEIDQKVGVMWKEAKNPSANLFSIGESPFIDRIMKEDIPTNFKVPGESYDGTSDPRDHLESFQALMVFHGVTDAIKCRAFSATLRKSARMCIQYKKASTHLMGVRQNNNESLRYFIQRFNKEALEVQDLDKSVALAALMNGKYINAEEMSKAGIEAERESSDKKRKKNEDQNDQGKRKKVWERLSVSTSSSKDQRNTQKYDNYTPLNASKNEILMYIQDKESIKWPGKMRTPANKRNRNRYCRYHRDHGHETEDCELLKKEIEDLIKRGHLSRFIDRDRQNPQPEQRHPREQSPDLQNPRGRNNPPPAGVIADGEDWVFITKTESEICSILKEKCRRFSGAPQTCQGVIMRLCHRLKWILAQGRFRQKKKEFAPERIQDAAMKRRS